MTDHTRELMRAELMELRPAYDIINSIEVVEIIQTLNSAARRYGSPLRAQMISTNCLALIDPDGNERPIAYYHGTVRDV